MSPRAVSICALLTLLGGIPASTMSAAAKDEPRDTVGGAHGQAPARARKEADRLRSLQKQIEREQRAVQAAREARSDLVESLRTLDQTLAGVEESLLAAEREARGAEGGLADTEAGIARLEEERRALESRLGERLRALYKFGRVGYVRILFSSKDYQDFARRSRFLGRVVASDAQLIGEYRTHLASLQAERQRLETAGRTLDQRRADAAGRRGEAESRRAEKLALLARLEQEQDGREATLRDLERAAESLQGVFFRLREAESPARPSDTPEAPPPGTAATPAGGGSLSTAPGTRDAFSVLKGRLPLPAEGRVVKTFGLRTDPELKTQIRSNGITVRAPYGAPIRAVADGRVLYAGWFRGYGRILIVDHGEGYYTLVAHASELLRRVGDPVLAGEEIARVGDSGSLEGPIVYFEIRREGRPLDPKEWLRS